MSENYMKTGFLILICIIFFIILTGCVEVTPPTGEQNASAYGPGTGGDMKKLADGQESEAPGDEDKKTTETQPPDNNQEPSVPVPPTPNDTFVQVTPRNYEELNPDKPVSYLQYNQPISTTDRQFITVHNITNQTFFNNASAYVYDLTTPPLYIELGFNPEMITDELEVYKRTGDKEGTVTYTKVRPSQDSWFEMRVYDLKTNQEILREGYGKTYSMTNKTTAIRRAGKFQFDFMGDAISVDIAMKIPVNSSSLSMYSNVSTLIEDQKKKNSLLPRVFITGQDLGQEWQMIGTEEHSPSHYSSIHNIPTSGLKLMQEISRQSSSDEINKAYLTTKSKNSGESQIAITAGDEGYGFESVRKSGVVFKQGLYLVELTSISVPPVPLSDLKKYGTIISGRISAL